MPFRLKPTDLDILFLVADYRILDLDQLSLSSGMNRKTLERRAGQLADAGYLIRHQSPRTRGRPALLFVLAEEGAKLLLDEKRVSSDLSYELLSGFGERLFGHQLALNAVRLLVERLPDKQVEFESQFLSSTSPFQTIDSRGQQWREVVVSRRGKDIRILPDGIFCLRHREQGRSLLFFLEVDMGTESLTSEAGHKGSLEAKIRNYQHLFLSTSYRRFARLWPGSFHGFRLLIVCPGESRVNLLAKHLRRWGPVDFVWTGELSTVVASGLAAQVWIRGGRIEEGYHSILRRS